MIPTQDNKNRRTLPSITTLAERKITSAELKDYSGNAVVTLQWHLNEASKQDRIFQISINGETALLDLEEFLAYSRVI